MREMRIKRDLVTTAQMNLKNMMQVSGFVEHTGRALAVPAAAWDRGVVCESSEGVQCYREGKKRSEDTPPATSWTTMFSLFTVVLLQS